MPDSPLIACYHTVILSYTCIHCHSYNDNVKLATLNIPLVLASSCFTLKTTQMKRRRTAFPSKTAPSAALIVSCHSHHQPLPNKIQPHKHLPNPTNQPSTAIATNIPTKWLHKSLFICHPLRTHTNGSHALSSNIRVTRSSLSSVLASYISGISPVG
jgi:hypothetical protein